MADGTDGGRLLLALAMASEIAGTVGWDADEIVAAADEVLAEGPCP